MECYRVQVPDGAKIDGLTATGRPAAVLPGEYLVHRLRPMTSSKAPPMLRFVGADALGRDVHVPLDAVQSLLELPEELVGFSVGGVDQPVRRF